jgi:hypothetical protein
MWQPPDQVEFKFAFNAISHVGVDPEHPPISPLSLWERARVRGFLWEVWKSRAAYKKYRKVRQKLWLRPLGAALIVSVRR